MRYLFFSMYREFKVAAPLRPYIQCIWMVKASTGAFDVPQRLVPDGNIECMFNYGHSFAQAWSNGSNNVSVYKGSCLVGQRPAYYFTSATGQVDLVSISFKPGGLSPFIHQPVADLTGSTVPLSLLNNYLFLEIEERMAGIGAIDERIRLIENILIKKLYDNRDKLESVDRFIPLVHAIKNYTSVAHFLKEHIIHERKLQREFDQHVGITPKFLQRVLRFRKAVAAFYSGPLKNLTALAYDCGYYDQAHFINEFKMLSGLSPKKFLQECSNEPASAWLTE
ncbi:MAG TPA: helix-turn-helix domain-containing protein [Chitinophagaceae bacterium]|nr:helix-turn-helix domain-containing protein [Chitinophagaceae bacterium]